MKHLDMRQDTIKKVTDVYKVKVTDCVYKIQKRFVKERGTMLERCIKDRQKFEQAIHRAGSTVQTSAGLRRKAAEELEEILARRRLLYDQAITSLRAMQEGLLIAPTSEG